MQEPVREQPAPRQVRGLLLLALVFALAGLAGHLVVRHAVSETIQSHALSVAEIVADHAIEARSVYARDIAGKLARDGTGPHVEAAERPGFVPIPAQFLKLMGRASSERTDRLYEYRPVSRWNIEPSQGLADDFLRWAWPQLEAQDAPNPTQPIAWRPVWRFEEQEGRRVLRYLAADPAAQPSCAQCHNTYEQTEPVRLLRTAAGLPEGKHWKQHQLLGALSVTVPLDRAVALGGAQVGQTTVFIFVILLTSFAALTWSAWQRQRQAQALRDKDLQLGRSAAETRASAELQQAYAELQTYMKAVDQHAIVSMADPQGRIVLVNDKLLSVSGYSREELLGRDHRVLGSGLHDRAFFRDMWGTIASGRPWRGVICNRRKDGQLYWVDSAIVPLVDQQGQVMRYVSIRIDITERMRAEQDAKRLAAHDGLTGLVNRGMLRDRIDRALRSDLRAGQRAAVLFIDLDQFKAINDSFGHAVGDRLLVEVARRLEHSVRAEDTVARQGGDEFIVFMPRIDEPDSAGVLASKLVQTLAQPFALDGQEFYIGSSVGIAVFPDHGEDVDTLLKNSDAAMYHVKAAGRNHHAFFAEPMHGQAMENYALVAELRKALERGQFELVYQPVVGLRSGCIEGLEALLRWRHPERGLVPPARFIPLAERAGLIVPMGEWVLRKACEQMRQWQTEGLDVPRIAVNLSAIQVHAGSLVPTVEQALRSHGLRPDQLLLEITEGSLMERTEAVLATLQRLSDLGVALAVDDFGTGYSSLSYLKTLPIDMLKIDRSFVKDIHTDPDDTAIVSAIVALARSLKLEVVAEGVETEAQLAYLRELGCDRFQGYLFSKPVDAAAVAGTLRTHAEA